MLVGRLSRQTNMSSGAVLHQVRTWALMSKALWKKQPATDQERNRKLYKVIDSFWVGRDLQGSSSPTHQPCAGTSSTTSACSKLHPTRPWTAPGMGHPYLLWVFHHPYCKIILSYMQSKFTLFSFMKQEHSECGIWFFLFHFLWPISVSLSNNFLLDNLLSKSIQFCYGVRILTSAKTVIQYCNFLILIIFYVFIS